MAAATSALMMASYGVQGTASLVGSYAQASAQRAQGDYQKKMFEMNARFANLNAEDAIKRGDKEASLVKNRARQMIGAQRSSMAAQGIAVDSGSAMDVQLDTASAGVQDAMTVRNNAWREAWGYRVQAQDLMHQGAMAKIAGRSAASQTLLTGGISAIGSFAKGAGQYGSTFGGSKTTGKTTTMAGSPTAYGYRVG